MLSEGMKDIEEFCKHKTEVSMYCEKCGIYLCKNCQVNDHFDHIENIKGLDAMFSQAVQKYETMNSELEKTLLRTEAEMKDGAIDETLLKVEKKITEEYDKLCKDIKEIEENHVSVVRSSSLVTKVQELKSKMEDNSYKTLVEFDKKLDSAISKLLGALANEEFESVAPLLTEGAKEEFSAEFKNNEPYIERQKELLKQIEVLKGIKPKITYNSQTIEELVQVRGVHEETIRLFLYSPDDNSVYIHYPKTKFFKKNELKLRLSLRKFAQVVLEDEVLFICGGKRKQKEYSNKCYCYVESDQKTTEKMNMDTSRASHAIANKKDTEIYVAGGMNESGLLASAELYDVKAGSWKALPNISKARKNCTLCLLSDKYLYLIGGDSTLSLNLVEVLNLNDPKSWEQKNIAKAPGVEKAGAIQVADNQILVFGGKCNGKKTLSCMVYDLSNEVILPKAAIPLAASFNKSDTRRLGGMVYATGNSKGQTFMYDPSLNQWTMTTKENYTLKYSWD